MRYNSAWGTEMATPEQADGKLFSFDWRQTDMAAYANLSTSIDPSLLEYLRYESTRRNISIEQAYREEMEGQERAKKNALTHDQLRKIAAKSTPDPRLLEGDEECPF
jgi:hypothetical protein